MRNDTLVLGASLKPDRYANMAVKKLRAYDYGVKAFGLQERQIADVAITKKLELYDTIDTITLYLNPRHQKGYYEYILALKPRRVIFNPGTENRDLMELLQRHGIESEIVCTLVLLSTGQY